jgi:hypothetical protein
MKYRVEIRRNNLREEPYVVQERWYITSNQRAYLKSLRFVIAEENAVPKNIRNYELISTLESKCLEITKGYENYEIFSDESLYFKCIGKYTEISDGWMITKKIN